MAKAKSIDVQKVIGAMVAGATKRIDQAVTDGHLSADRASSLKAELTQRITTLVNEGRPTMEHHPFRPGPGLALDAAAEALRISESELHDQLRAGKTIADVAKAKSIDVQKVIGAMVADATKRIDQAVTDGHLSADRAASLKAELTQRTTTLVNEGAPFKGGPPFGPGRAFPGGRSGFSPRAFGGQFD